VTPVRTAPEERAYRFGRACRRRGLTTRQADLETARRLGIIDTLLDAATDGWNDQDDAMLSTTTAESDS